MRRQRATTAVFRPRWRHFTLSLCLIVSNLCSEGVMAQVRGGGGALSQAGAPPPAVQLAVNGRTPPAQLLISAQAAAAARRRDAAITARVRGTNRDAHRRRRENESSAARAARLDAQRQRQAILRAQRRNQVELNDGVDDAPLPSLFERIFGRPRANPAGPSPAARPPPRVVLPSTMRERFAAAVRARAVADAAAVAALVPHRAPSRIGAGILHDMGTRAPCVHCGAPVWSFEGARCCHQGREVLGPGQSPPIDPEYEEFLRSPGLSGASRSIQHQVCYGAMGTTPARADGGREVCAVHLSMVCACTTCTAPLS